MNKSRIAILALSSALVLATTVAPSQAGGYRGYGYGKPGYSSSYVPYRKKRNTAAIAAGVIGALALGTLGTQAYGSAGPIYPVQPNSYPGAGYGYGALPAYQPVCTVVQRRIVDPYGMQRIVNEQVCN